MQQTLRVGLALLLIVAHALGMLLSLKTHRELFASAAHNGGGEAGEARWPITLALGTVAGFTVLVALVSEIFVESVPMAAEDFGMTPVFVGFIVVALVGGAADHLLGSAAGCGLRADPGRATQTPHPTTTPVMRRWRSSL